MASAATLERRIFTGGDVGAGVFNSNEVRDSVQTWYANRASSHEKEAFLHVFGGTLGLDRATPVPREEKKEQPVAHVPTRIRTILPSVTKASQEMAAATNGPGAFTLQRAQYRTYQAPQPHLGVTMARKTMAPGVRGPPPLATDAGGVLPGLVQHVSSAKLVQATGQPGMFGTLEMKLAALKSAPKKKKKTQKPSNYTVVNAAVHFAALGKSSHHSSPRKGLGTERSMSEEELAELENHTYVNQQLDLLAEKQHHVSADEHEYQEKMQMSMGLGGLLTSNQSTYGMIDENPLLYKKAADAGRGRYPKDNPSFISEQVQNNMNNVPPGVVSLKTQKMAFDEESCGPPVKSVEYGGESLFFQNVTRNKTYYGKLLSESARETADSFLQANVSTGTDEDATQARREFLSTFRNLYTTANDRTKITEYKERFQGTQRDLKAVLEEMELNEDINQGGIMDEIIKSRKIEDGKRARAEREAERRAEIEAANKKLDADREEFKRINEQYAAQQSP
ncbi:hypothetical protein NFJ02_04g115190 [Pycnococcus provasolii]